MYFPIEKIQEKKNISPRSIDIRDGKLSITNMCKFKIKNIFIHHQASGCKTTQSSFGLLDEFQSSALTDFQYSVSKTIGAGAPDYWYFSCIMPDNNTYESKKYFRHDVRFLDNGFISVCIIPSFDIFLFGSWSKPYTHTLTYKAP